MALSRIVTAAALVGLAASSANAAVRPGVASMRTAPVAMKAPSRAATPGEGRSDLAGSAFLIPLLGGLVVIVAVAVSGGNGNVSPR